MLILLTQQSIFINILKYFMDFSGQSPSEQKLLTMTWINIIILELLNEIILPKLNKKIHFLLNSAICDYKHLFCNLKTALTIISSCAVSIELRTDT